MANVRNQTFGEYIAAARATMGVSLRTLGARLSLSAPYLHDVEHDRRTIVEERWPLLAATLPGVTVDGLVRGAVQSAVRAGRVTVDLRGASEEEIAMVVRMVERAGRQRVGKRASK